eukprot:Awhi_evm2s9701
MIPVIIDMETGDPDDILTLMFASHHPRIDLKAITVTPGSEEQLVVVQYVLHKLGKKNIRIGAQNWPINKDKKGCVNMKFYNTFLHPPGLPSSNIRGRIDSSEISPAGELIKEVCSQHENITIFTGGPNHNLGRALELGATIPRWVGQGGFCGEGLIPDTVSTLRQFQGKTHISTWNFGGSREATLLALNTKNITNRVLVGKNVCHRCLFDEETDERLRSHIKRMKPSPHKSALDWISKCLSTHYLSNSYRTSSKGDGNRFKKLHDPLAFATLIDERVCLLREVEIDVIKGSWGSTACEGTNTFAAVDYSHDLFIDVLLGNI